MRAHDERLKLAREVLEGLSVGDAIGEALSYRHDRVREGSDFSVFRDGTVCYTDDTEMAIAVFETLRLMRGIDEDAVAWAFAVRYRREPDRGYGRMARKILDEISLGAPWEEVSRNAFGGGSFGNGAAMRVGPLGGYFSDDIDSIPGQATRSARVTHYHPEGIAGAVAVAVAAGAACATREQDVASARESIWESVLRLTPESRVRERLQQARSSGEITTFEAAREFGNGAEISAQDTVPFCLWNACRCLDDFPEAIVSTIEVGGDCDTNSAIVGGIVGGFAGADAIPPDWLRVREPLDLRL